MADTGTANLAFPNVTDSGFGFENCRRNEMLVNQAAGGALQSLPKARKTGTTIVGCVYADGVVLGADTRATSSLVVDKNCEKIHYIAPNIYCCGAGTAADTERVLPLAAVLRRSALRSLLAGGGGRSVALARCGVVVLWCCGVVALSPAGPLRALAGSSSAAASLTLPLPPAPPAG